MDPMSAVEARLWRQEMNPRKALLDTKMVRVGDGVWESRSDPSVRVERRYHSTYLGGGRRSSIPIYFIERDGKSVAMLLHRQRPGPVAVWAAVRSITGEAA